MPLSFTGRHYTVHIFSEFFCIGVFCTGDQWHGVVYKLFLCPSSCLQVVVIKSGFLDKAFFAPPGKAHTVWKEQPFFELAIFSWTG